VPRFGQSTSRRILTSRFNARAADAACSRLSDRTVGRSTTHVLVSLLLALNLLVRMRRLVALPNRRHRSSLRCRVEAATGEQRRRSSTEAKAGRAGGGAAGDVAAAGDQGGGAPSSSARRVVIG